MMKYSRVKSVTFTGHRFISFAHKSIVRMRLEDAIRKAYNNGCRNFFCGMAMGFDLLAAEVVLSLKEELSELVLVAIVPFSNQDFKFTPSDKIRYRGILRKADDVLILSKYYYKGCLLRRNDFMLENTASVIAFYNGEQRGGTFYTCKRAEERRIPVLNLF